jgi:hypothetical protein
LYAQKVNQKHENIEGVSLTIGLKAKMLRVSARTMSGPQKLEEYWLSELFLQIVRLEFWIQNPSDSLL